MTACVQCAAYVLLLFSAARAQNVTETPDDLMPPGDAEPEKNEESTPWVIIVPCVVAVLTVIALISHFSAPKKSPPLEMDDGENLLELMHQEAGRDEIAADKPAE